MDLEPSEIIKEQSGLLQTEDGFAYDSEHPLLVFGYGLTYQSA